MEQEIKYIKVPAVFFDKEKSDSTGTDVFITYMVNISIPLIIGWYGYPHKDENGVEKEFVKLMVAGSSFTVALTSEKFENMLKLVL